MFEWGLCHREENSNLDWHSEDPVEQNECKQVCLECPIMAQCAQYALTNKELWGIWGGMDDFKVRRAIAVDEFGDVRRRVYKQHCPFCDNVDLEYSNKKTNEEYDIDCLNCGMSWKSFIVPAKVKKSLERKYGPNMGKSVV